MKRLHLFMLAYNQAELCEEAVKLCEEQLGSYPVSSKVIYNPHYPLADKTEQAFRLSSLALKCGWEYCEIENQGVSGNWNQAIAHKNLGEGDVLIGIDPDERPQQAGWLDAAMDVFNNAPECYYVGLNQPKMPNAPHKLIGSTWVIDYPSLVAWPAGGFDIGWMKRIGGLAQDHPVYAYLEHAVSRRASPLGGKFYMLRDFYDLHLESSDAKYQEWKKACAAHRTTLSLDGWLNAGK